MSKNYPPDMLFIASPLTPYQMDSDGALTQYQHIQDEYRPLYTQPVDHSGLESAVEGAGFAFKFQEWESPFALQEVDRLTDAICEWYKPGESFYLSGFSQGAIVALFTAAKLRSIAGAPQPRGALLASTSPYTADLVRTGFLSKIGRFMSDFECFIPEVQDHIRQLGPLPQVDCPVQLYFGEDEMRYIRAQSTLMLGVSRRVGMVTVQDAGHDICRPNYRAAIAQHAGKLITGERVDGLDKPENAYLNPHKYAALQRFGNRRIGYDTVTYPDDRPQLKNPNWPCLECKASSAAENAVLVSV